MNFHTYTTLAGYARTAVGLKTRMDAYCRSTGGKRYLTAFAQAFNDNADPDHPATPDLIDAVHRLASSAWRVGEPYVLAPAMTAIVAAAADALDLTGETLHEQVAPGDFGVLFLPDPIYTRKPHGQITGIAAITWARLSSPSGSAWAIAGWSARSATGGRRRRAVAYSTSCGDRMWAPDSAGEKMPPMRDHARPHTVQCHACPMPGAP